MDARRRTRPAAPDRPPPNLHLHLHLQSASTIYSFQTLFHQSPWTRILLPWRTSYLSVLSPFAAAHAAAALLYFILQRKTLLLPRTMVVVPKAKAKAAVTARMGGGSSSATTGGEHGLQAGRQAGQVAFLVVVWCRCCTQVVGGTLRDVLAVVLSTGAVACVCVPELLLPACTTTYCECLL